MSDTQKAPSKIGAQVSKTLKGFKDAPLGTKIAAGALSAGLSVATFFIGRATKKSGKK